MFNSYPDILTAQQVCTALSLGKNMVYAMLADGTIPSVRVGTKYLIPKIYLIEYIEKSISCNSGRS